jgi:hypothetical protein
LPQGLQALSILPAEGYEWPLQILAICFPAVNGWAIEASLSNGWAIEASISNGWLLNASSLSNDWAIE